MVSSQVGFLKKVLIFLGFSVTFVTKPDTARLLQDFSRDTSANNSPYKKSYTFAAHIKRCAPRYFYIILSGLENGGAICYDNSKSKN